MGVVLLTTGVPGCGKTYVRGVRFLLDDFLVNSSGHLYSNFPLNVDEISAEVSRRSQKRSLFHLMRKVTPEDVSARIHRIPDDVLRSWSAELSGPWDYFAGVDLKDAHISIDEIHNFVSDNKSKEYLSKWDIFLGEVRHRGCTFEAITQDASQVSQILIGRAATRLELVPAEDLRDPFFHVPMGDWYELKGAFTGLYHKTVFEVEKRHCLGRWKTNNTRRFLLLPEYFKYWNSFSASLQEGEGADKNRATQYEFQKRTKTGLVFWFLSRNWFSIFWRLLLGLFVIWLCFCGGLNVLITGFMKMNDKSYRANGGKPSSSFVSSAPVNTSSSPPANSSLVAFIDKNGTPVYYTAEQIKSIENERKRLKDEKDLYLPSLFFGSSCWLRNGLEISVGFVFPSDSPYKEKKVVEIDTKKRSVTLSDGECLIMRL